MNVNSIEELYSDEESVKAISDPKLSSYYVYLSKPDKFPKNPSFWIFSYYGFHIRNLIYNFSRDTYDFAFGRHSHIKNFANTKTLFMKSVISFLRIFFIVSFAYSAYLGLQSYFQNKPLELLIVASYFIWVPAVMAVGLMSFDFFMFVGLVWRVPGYGDGVRKKLRQSYRFNILKPLSFITFFTTIFWISFFAIANNESLKVIEFLEHCFYLFGLFTLFFWRENQKLVGKWNYANKIYEKIYFDELQNVSSTRDRVKLGHMLCTFGIDLLEMNLWSHSSFNPPFKAALELSVLGYGKSFGYLEGKSIKDSINSVLGSLKEDHETEIITENISAEVEKLLTIVFEVDSIDSRKTDSDKRLAINKYAVKNLLIIHQKELRKFLLTDNIEKISETLNEVPRISYSSGLKNKGA